MEKHNFFVPITTDYLIQVKNGLVPGASIVEKFGRNDSVPNGSWAFINLLGFTDFPISSPTTVRIKAGGSANDIAAGSGAREITIQGIDSNGDEVSEVIATNGANVSANSTNSYWRVHRFWVSECGTYGGSNESDIVIENSAGTQDIIKVAAGEGQTQYCVYTIPKGKKGSLLSVHVTVDSNLDADIRIFTREQMTATVAPFQAKRIKKFFDGVNRERTYVPRSPELNIPELTDIWIEARGAGASTQVSGDLELLIEDV
jgi:hypothetical protein